jgi:hypothetical protein
MSLVDSIIQFLSNKEKSEKDAPEGLCPNCWGRQEYSGQFYKAAKNENVDVNAASEHRGWVQEYADKHLSDIKLVKEDDVLVCKVCSVTYRPD